MSKFKKIGSLALAVVLCMTMLVSCGDKGKNTAEPAEKKASLSGDVKIVAAEGTAYASVSKLPGDYKVKKAKDTMEVKATIVKGDFDLAVLSPIEAARLFVQNDNFKVVTTVALGDYEVGATGYVENEEEEPNISYLRGKRIYALDEEPEVTDHVTVTLPDAKDGEEELEIEAPLEMSEEVLRAVMADENIPLYSGSLDWQNEDALKDIATVSNIRILADGNTVKALEKDNEDFITLFDLGQMWNENFGGDIPGYVLVASDSFLKNRGKEISVVLDDMADNLKEAQKATKEKLVVYNNSNRGLSLIKKFNEAMEENNIDAIGGEELPNSYYYSK